MAYTGKPADSVVTTQPAMMRAQGVSFIATAWPASAKEVIGRSISVGRSICATELCRAGASALDAAGCSTNASLTQQSIMIMAARSMFWGAPVKGRGKFREKTATDTQIR